MKLTQLRYFQGICRWGSLSRAARELHISQSVLSGTIKELEEEFGVLLFSRSGRGLVLTKEGEFFLGEAESLLDHADQMEERMGQFKNAGQTVHLGVSPMLSVLLFPRLLARFQRAFPAAKLELTEGGSQANIARVEDGTLDAAVISCGEELPGLDSWVLGTLNIRFFVGRSHPLAGRRSLRVEEAAGIPLALLGEDSFLTNYMEEQFKIRGAKLNAVLYTNQLAAVGQIVREGTAAAFLFEGVLPPEPEVAVIPVEDLPAARVCLVRKEGGKLSPCAGQFIRMVKEAGGDWGPGLSTPVL